ncbi:hypothetical protein ACWOAH_09950 [Vagococcus vulneris]|uniref:Uncharacterized protein n=1 Tax=Vagococcus vulneris TaxID=1977869 RepID=A0A429ZWS2_9ENTE|nr:hypothetical protein [Vagococcus vulneris]RST98265.1 hypothetical protein CBF37_08100 [Vagococcus vulneris]
MKKENLLKMNLQQFAEKDIVTTDGLGEIKSIDFVNLFGYSIDELLQVLGVTRRMTLTKDEKVQTYKWVRTMAANNAVGEGETIPLSKVERKKDREFVVPLHKYRKVVTAEAIDRHGYDMAVNETDREILEEVQDAIKNQFFTYLGTAPTKQKATGLQSALSLGWGEAKKYFRGNVPMISFINPMDVAKYLGEAPIQSGASTDYGFTLLTGFLNQTVVVFDSIPEGKVYTTAVNNIVLANKDVSSSEMARTFNLTTEQSGLIGVTHGTTLNNLTVETVALEGIQLFTEVLNGVVETTIEEPKPEEKKENKPNE